EVDAVLFRFKAVLESAQQRGFIFDDEDGRRAHLRNSLLPGSRVYGRSWDGNREGAATARFAFHRNAAVVGAYDKLHDAQSQTAAAAIARQPSIHLMERMKNPFGLMRRDSDSVVQNGERHVSILCAGAQDDVLDVF